MKQLKKLNYLEKQLIIAKPLCTFASVVASIDVKQRQAIILRNSYSLFIT